jgi:hypothetical protein
MREIRSSGSVEGVLSNGHPYSDSREVAASLEGDRRHAGRRINREVQAGISSIRRRRI